MNETSHACVSEVATMDDVCCEKHGHGNKSSIISGEMDGLGMDTSPCSTPYSTPPLSPQNSGEEIELRDAGQSHADILFTDELMEKGIGNLVQMDEGQLSHASVVDDGATFPITAGQNILSGHLQLETDQDATKKSSDDSFILWDTNVSSDPHQDILSDNQFTKIQRVVSVEDSDLGQSQMIDVEEVTSLPMPGGEFIPLNEHVMDQLDNTKENAIVYNNILNTEPDMKPGADFDSGSDNLPLVLPSFDTDPLIWLPPEPANKEDDIDDAANHDDDSDNSDTRWARSSFDISFDEERSKGSRKDQLQKAMSEVMNGEFKILVSRFLAAEGFSLSDGRTNNCWLDIVASLSWDAALLVRPDAKGNEMDPGLYVKVKCIASGSRQQSEVIKGLVFKKSAAHKQMRTNIKHPKLLVLQGAIGHSSTGLSSMDLMKQENEQLEKTLNDVIRKYHPDVILVEKGVSRNLNEYFQKQGVTVVSDMNIRRLERIARCTGSPIISLQDVLKETNLIKQCESLRFEKFVDEHNITEDDGRRSAKTFLFLEGLPEPLGCTILLKGSTRENLKKIKSLLHFTVFAAYHLILETSFFADQRLFITENNATEKANSLETGPQLLVPCRASSQSKLCSDNSESRGTMKHDLNIPTSDEQYNLEDIATTKKHDSKIVTSRDPQGRLNDRKDPLTNLIEVISSSEAESTSCGGFDGSTSASSKKLIMQKKEAFGGNGEETFEDIMCTENRTDLNSQVILVSMSSQHIRSQAVCEQSHLSRITYYGYCDTTLRRYLQDILLNERHNCLSCLEPPEAHMYSYTHHDGTLTVLVKSLPLEATLPGEGQRRIWMWTRCLRCNGKPTQRVVISSSARNLSFGKFLELSFSTHSAAKKLSTCGHLLHRDCLRFFGLGSRVAMFRYSSIAIYSAFEPPLTWEFHNPNKKEWLDVEVKNVLLKWKLLFSEIEDILQGLKSRYSSQDIGGKSNISAYGGLILEVSGMLAQEKNELEVSLKAFDHIAKPEACAHEILQLNWLYQQLLLGLYIWDVRLRHLLQYSKVSAASSENLIHETILENKLRNPKNITVHGDTQYCSDDVDNSCGGMILEKGQLTDKSVIEEHELYRLSLSSGEEIGENGSRQGVSSVPIDNHICLEKSIFLPVKNDEHPEPVIGNEIYPVDIPKKCLPPLQNLLYFMRDDTKKWVWNKFSHMEMGYKKEIQGGSLDKFHLINKYSPYSSSLAQFKCQMDSMHFIARPCGTILSITEEEISSIIAYALAISEHQGIYSETSFARDELVARRNVDKVARSNLFRDASMPSSILSPSGSSEQDHNLSINASSLSLDKTTSGFYDSFLSALKDLHPEIGLNSEKLALKSKYTVVSIYAKQFYNFRKICCPSELAYILSISRCKIWNAQGGKSKAFFAKSMDDRFIIKQIKKTEFDSFLKFGLEYFKHFGVSNASSNPTCLAKILGIYQVKELRNGKETRTNFMVMENLLFGHDILRRYDLKGALFSRYVPNSKNPESVLLDQNFIEDMRTMPIYIEGKNKNLMERAIWNDTSFLCGMNVMDYSLFLGVDKQKKELVFGIIDYLRQYTWDKQLESWVKTSLVVPKNLSPTVISPKEYKIRFRAFMSQYFLSVPDA